jgi:hypothetical protein
MKPNLGKEKNDEKVDQLLCYFHGIVASGIDLGGR